MSEPLEQKPSEEQIEEQHEAIPEELTEEQLEQASGGHVHNY